jgi:hypothetical protein
MLDVFGLTSSNAASATSRPCIVPAVLGRCDHRPSGRRDRASVSRGAQEKPKGARRCRRSPLGAGRSQNLLRAAHASSRAEATAVEALVDVGDRGALNQQFLLAQIAPTRSLKRLCITRAGKSWIE